MYTLKNTLKNTLNDTNTTSSVGTPIKGGVGPAVGPNGQPFTNPTAIDKDGDGVPDTIDMYPDDPNYWDAKQKSDNPYTDGTGSQSDSSSLTNTSSTIDKLNDFLNNLGAQISDWSQFYDLLNLIYTQTGRDDFVKGDAARLAMTEKIGDMVYNFALTLYNNAFNSQMWYEQQVYNSPLLQLQRLAEAGLVGSASQIGTGNAQSTAAGSQTTAAESSDAAALQQQAKQNKIQNAFQGIGLSLEFANLGIQGFQAATEFGVKKAEKELIQTKSGNIKAMEIPMMLNLIANTTKTESEIGVNKRMADFKGQEVANAVTNTRNTLHMWEKDYEQRQSQFEATQAQNKEIAYSQLATQERMNSANNAAAIKIAQMSNDKAEELANNFEWVEDGYFMYTGENQTAGRWVSSEEVTDMMEKTAGGDFSVGSKALGMDLGLDATLKGTDVLKKLRSTDIGQSLKVGNTTFRRQTRTVRMTLKEALKRQEAAAKADRHNLGDFPSQHTNPVANTVFLHNQNNIQRHSAKVAGCRATASVMSPPAGPR